MEKEDRIKYFYDLWRKRQENYKHILTDEIIPLVFPLEYLRITKKEIQKTEDKNKMNKLIQVKSRVSNLQN